MSERYVQLWKKVWRKVCTVVEKSEAKGMYSCGKKSVTKGMYSCGKK